MHEFKINDYVKMDWCGTTLRGRIVSVNKVTARILTEFALEYRVPFSKLTYLPPIKVGKDDYKALVKLEKDILAFLGDNVVDNIVNEDEYVITVEDFLSALTKIAENGIDEDAFFVWSDFMCGELIKQYTRDCNDVYTEKEVIRAMHTQIYHPWDGFNPDDVLKAIEEGTVFVEDKNKPYPERRYPLYVKEGLIESLATDDAMNRASEKQIELYRLFAEELASVDNVCGLDAVGYGCYGGNRAFGCDWKRSLECISRLFEIENKMPQKAFYANTLGYIYYYGRCNGGVPEYEKAYMYYSMAAFNGVYEAQYKVADMFKNGYGVVKSLETAENIIIKLYNENIKYIRDGSFDCKFADVALRMGGICSERYDEDGCNFEDALHYYTQAEFAVRMRMLEKSYYGDAKVYDAVSNAIAEVKEKLDFEPLSHSIYFSLEGLLGDEVSDGRKLDLVIKKKSDLTYKLTFSPHKTQGEKHSRKMFITVPEIEMCGLFSKITLTYEADEALAEDVLDKVFVIDEITYGELRGEGVPVIRTEGYYSLKRIKKTDNKTYRFVSVSFGSAKTYDYLCADESISVGDRVIVDASGEKTEAMVCRVFEKTESEMSLPLKTYKSVLKKYKR